LNAKKKVLDSKVFKSGAAKTEFKFGK